MIAQSGYGSAGVDTRALRRADARQTPHRVVVAEDDRDMRELVAWGLKGRGYDVIECDNGAIAIHAVDLLTLNGVDISLVITDIRMPSLTGLQALGLIREAQPYIPLIVMTAFPQPDARVAAGKLGVAGFFSKPFDIEQLCRLVDQLLRPCPRA